jgi:hypothetical protein
MKFPLASYLLGAGLLLWGSSNMAASSAPPAQKPFAGDVFLGLENGSLVESVYFGNVWKKLHPDETVVIIFTSPSTGTDSEHAPVTAVTLYTINGAVRAHTIDYGKVRLNSLEPDDLRKHPIHCRDEYFKAIAELNPNPTPLVGTRDEQVQRAFDALHNPKKISFFPVAVAKMAGLSGRCLVFDWNDTHYVWKPSIGAIRIDSPKDPVTGRPLLCVKHSDLVEALIFVTDFKKLHPYEKAGLLFGPNKAGSDSIGLAAAAYTLNGAVHVRGYYFGDQILDKNPHSFSPDDLAALAKMYENLLVNTVTDFYEKTHSYEPPPDSYWSHVYDELPSVFPQSLPGDTDEMQQNRVYQRAKEAGLPCEIASNDTRGRLVIMHWLSQRFSYAGTCNYYYGDWDATDLAQLNSAEEFLALDHASLIESIHFRAVWTKVHPTEDAIVLVTSPGPRKDGKYPPVTAVTAYTNNGKVWAHSTDYGRVELRALDPADLQKNVAHCLDEYLKTIAKLPRKPATFTGNSDEQVQRALSALQDPATMPYFPVSIAGIPRSMKMPDGSTVNSVQKTLFFDWNDARYSWWPSTDALRTDSTKDPRTGRPHLCVNHGDLVEALIFVHDFQRAHPDEKAVLLYAPPEINQGVSTYGLAAAAYSWQGTVHVHGYFSQDIMPNSKSHPLKPADLDNAQAMASLFQVYKDDLLDIAKQYYAKTHPGEKPSNNLRTEICDVLPTICPQGLYGDTPEMQENRIFQRATEAGIPCVIAEQKGAGRMVVLHWRAQRFCYTGNWDQTGKPLSFYDGVWDPNDPERLIDAILFEHDFHPQQPDDAVVVLPYRQLGFWDIAKGIAVYARDGKVFAHNPEVGDAPIPGVTPADLGAPDRYNALRLAANQAIHSIDGPRTISNNTALEQKLGSELQADVLAQNLQNDKAGRRRCIYGLLMRPADMSNVEVPSVYKKLQAAGIPCRLFPTTTERRSDGTIFEEARPCLKFTYQGVDYTYGPEHFCSAADTLVHIP